MGDIRSVLKYKRTKNDSPLYCPYCGKQFRMTLDRYLSYYKQAPHETICRGCGKRFFYINIGAKYARENNISATWKVGENGNTPVL